jgi:hypothetical protein
MLAPKRSEDIFCPLLFINMLYTIRRKTMPFKKYLTEIEFNAKTTDEWVSKIWEMVQTDCSQYLKQSQKDGKMLWRGARRNVDYVKKLYPIENRMPMSTKTEVHKWLNKEFDKMFGWKVRNGVFATGDKNVSRYYGNQNCMFFPTDPFEFVWSPSVKDMYESIDDYFSDDEAFMEHQFSRFPEVFRKRYGNDYKEWMYEMHDKVKDQLESYQNIDLPGAKESGHEISFYVPQGYYLVHGELYQRVIGLLK